MDGRGEAPGGAAAANGAIPITRKRIKRRSWSVDENIRIARESFAPSETITAVLKRHVLPAASRATDCRRGARSCVI